MGPEIGRIIRHIRLFHLHQRDAGIVQLFRSRNKVTSIRPQPGRLLLDNKHDIVTCTSGKIFRRLEVVIHIFRGVRICRCHQHHVDPVSFHIIPQDAHAFADLFLFRSTHIGTSS